ARDELLAGAGLAADEQGEVGARDLLEDREDLAHPLAATEELVEVIALADLDLDVALGRLEPDAALADAEHHLRLEPRLADLDVTQEGAVRRLEIADDHPLFAHLDLAVRGAHGGVVEHQVADRAAPDGHPLLPDDELTPLGRPREDQEAALLERA